MDLNVDLIKIAQADLKAAKILYGCKEYRTSFFMFQQAAEKASKVLGVMLGRIKDENSMRKLGHSMEVMFFSMFQEILFNGQNILRLLDTNIEFSKTQFGKVFKQFEIDFNNDMLKKFPVKNVIEKTSLSELDHVLFTLKSLQNGRMDILQLSLNGNEINTTLTELIAVSGIKEFESRKQLEDFIASDHLKEFIATFLRPKLKELCVLFLSILFCTILVKGHVSFVRYPSNGKSPIGYYTLRNPIVKRQLEFMNFLSKALIILKKMSVGSL